MNASKYLMSCFFLCVRSLRVELWSVSTGPEALGSRCAPMNSGWDCRQAEAGCCGLHCLSSTLHALSRVSGRAAAQAMAHADPAKQLPAGLPLDTLVLVLVHLPGISSMHLLIFLHAFHWLYMTCMYIVHFFPFPQIRHGDKCTICCCILPKIG